MHHWNDDISLCFSDVSVLYKSTHFPQLCAMCNECSGVVSSYLDWIESANAISHYLDAVRISLITTYYTQAEMSILCHMSASNYNATVYCGSLMACFCLPPLSFPFIWNIPLLNDGLWWRKKRIGPVELVISSHLWSYHYWCQGCSVREEWGVLSHYL